MVGPAAASPFAERPTSSSKPAVVVVCIRHLSISFLGYPSAVVQLTPSLTRVDVSWNNMTGCRGEAPQGCSERAGGVRADRWK